MKIVVCIKQVPDTTDVKIDPVTNTLKRDGVPSIINPDDKAALELALRQKDLNGDSVAVLCMGPTQAEKALREALAMGADEAYLMSDKMFAGSDTLATSTIIAAGLRAIGYDLILTGRQAIDGDTAQVGPQIAELLDLPQVTYCVEITQNGEFYDVKRQIEDAKQRLRVSAPFLATVTSVEVTPRYMNVGDIIGQESKEINLLTLKDIKVDANCIGLNGSPTKVKSTFVKQINNERNVVELSADEAAKLIVETLLEKHYV